MESNAEALITSTLPADEESLGVHPWTTRFWDDTWQEVVDKVIDLAITDKHFHINSVKRGWFSGEPISVRGDTAIRYRDIAEISVMTVGRWGKQSRYDCDDRRSPRRMGDSGIFRWT